jgi:hypothetical protein
VTRQDLPEIEGGAKAGKCSPRDCDSKIAISLLSPPPSLGDFDMSMNEAPVYQK